jgi:hypothetical protein
MFGLFKKEESSARRGLRLEFEHVSAMMREADNVSQMAVGASINVANSLFMQRFQSVDSFRLLPKSLKMKYIHNLSALEEARAKEDPHFALGVGLFKMWIGAVVANDKDLEAQIFNELGFLSKKGDIPPE